MSRYILPIIILLSIFSVSCNKVSGPGDKEDKTPPVVTLTSPVGGEELIGTHAITWSNNEPNRYKVEIELSRDAGATYAEVISNLAPDIGTYDWDTNTVNDCRKCRIRIVATDTVGNVSVPAESALDFIVNNVPEVVGQALYFRDPVTDIETLEIPFDKEIEVRGLLPRDIFLPVLGDSFGVNATISQGPTRNALTINMGSGNLDAHFHVKGGYTQNRNHRTASSGVNIPANLSPGTIVAVDTGRTAQPSEGIDVVATYLDSGQKLTDGNLSKGVAVADVDNDLDLDVIIPSFPDNKLWINQGGLQGGTIGQFLDAGPWGTGISSFRAHLALADLDSDGDLDLVRAERSLVDDSRIFINQGGLQGGSLGTYLDSGQSLGITNAMIIKIADFDRDGDNDFIIGKLGALNQIWVNQGGIQVGTEGQFNAGQLIGTGGGSSEIALRDLDGDDDIDIMLGNSSVSSSRMWINQGGAQAGNEGEFLESPQILGGGSNLSLGDLDQDGDLDMLEGGGAFSTMSIWLNQGGLQGGTEGIFQVTAQKIGYGISSGAVLKDVDGDSDLDIVASYDDAIRIWINQGHDQQGVLGQYVEMPSRAVIEVESDSGRFVMEDIDRDGDPEIITPTGRIYVNSLRHPARNLFVDSTLVLGDSGNSIVSMGDMDGDGDLDIVESLDDMTVVKVIKLWINQGGAQGGQIGTFNNSVELLGSEPQTEKPIISDIDFDGDLDVIAPRVWINQGGIQSGTEGLFVDSGEVTGFYTFTTSAADFDGDGDVDVVTGGDTSFTSAYNGVYVNQGGLQSGVLNSYVNTPVIGNNFMRAVVAGDVDGDGDQDFIDSNTGFRSRIMINQGRAQGGTEGVFIDSGFDPGFSSAPGLELGDVDMDGDLDLILPSSNLVYFNQGGAQAGVAGEFLDSGQVFGGFSFKSSSVLGDLDGDGDPDLIMSDSSSNIRIWLNQDGIQRGNLGEFEDSGEILDSGFFNKPFTSGDIDNDGDLDIVIGRNGGSMKIWLGD